MIEFGKTLKAAREAKGLTIADIAERTRMMSSVIAALENEDFSHFAAPIYGRGFVRLYCQTVGIDPAPLIAEFMDIYSGNRETTIRERVVAPEPPPPLPPVEPVKTPPQDVQPDLFSAAAYVPSEPTRPEPVASAPAEPVFTAEPEVPLADPEPEEQPAPREHRFARYTTPLRERASSVPRLAPAAGRWLVVASLAGLAIWGAVAGVRALYQATRSLETAPAEATEEDARPSAPVVVESNVRTARTPLDVPPLYID